jgi:Cu(I)/Ag(I) efflux system membrane protein CusA/SilA
MAARPWEAIVILRQGENPLAVIERVKEKLRNVQDGLPAGTRIVPFYDRTG